MFGIKRKLNSSPQSMPDDLLTAFLSEPDDAAATRLLDQLIQALSPIISATVFRKLKSDGPVFIHQRLAQHQEDQDREDLVGEARARILAELQSTRLSRRDAPIRDICAYAVTVTARVISGYWRKRAPRRHSLSYSIRYLLEHKEGLALWTLMAAGQVGGFDVWRKAGKPDTTSSSKWKRLAQDPKLLTREVAPTLQTEKVTVEGLTALFGWVQHPLLFSDLIRIWAEILDIRDERPIDLAALNEEGTPVFAVVGTHLESDPRLILESWWAEIQQMTPGQCAALLLKASEVLEELQLTGVASLREMACAMGLSPQHLAQLWNDLPLDDARIGHELGIHPQSVARLRMNARERLRQKLQLLTAVQTARG